MRALGRLKNLEYLDGVQVTDEEMTTALKMAAASRPSSFAILAHARTDQSKPRTLSLVPTAQAILASSQNRPVKLQDDDSQWFIKVWVKMSNLCKQCSLSKWSVWGFLLLWPGKSIENWSDRRKERRLDETVLLPSPSPLVFLFQCRGRTEKNNHASSLSPPSLPPPFPSLLPSATESEGVMGRLSRWRSLVLIRIIISLCFRLQRWTSITNILES